ncbi:hypothetical protein PU634_04995 [Oceanimonas pelagia]|uniref:Uncharacterized protein n=1 Tax=Oceanimonas pelagia TaxID=3028314 RepID=A0AA50QD19_9GAMM|nr:hypothetical protein [Oceanimonas pelagia]WMC11724.1 hypothetical protein PU634_04995 [Oceanimonas pelagia]
MDDRKTIKMRFNASKGQLCREVAGELGQLPTEFARGSMELTLVLLAKHDPELMARAIKRANRVLAGQGYEPLTLIGLLEDLREGPVVELLANERQRSITNKQG